MKSFKPKLSFHSKIFAGVLILVAFSINSVPVFPQTDTGTDVEPIKPSAIEPSAAMQAWLTQHQAWRDHHPNWYELTRYPELIIPDLESCFGIQPQFAYEIDNYLKIKIGTGFSTIVKLVELDSSLCVRIAYITNGDSCFMRNIPEGIYYLKIAYGSDVCRENLNGKPTVRFNQNAFFKKGDDLLDFHLQEAGTEVIGDAVYQNFDIPVYSLFLDVIADTVSRQFDAHVISEEAFNQE